MSDQNSLPKRMNAAESSSFAFKSLSERLPKIVTGIVDKLHRYHHKAVEERGQEAGDDVTAVVSKLSEMRYRMMTDKPLEPISSEFPDAQLWNSEMANFDEGQNDKQNS
uniref:Sugar phosphate phosphatase n=1 Tax=Globodera pallida TaxID=36090 RepID=A0A183CQ81_GLOPA